PAPKEPQPGWDLSFGAPMLWCRLRRGKDWRRTMSNHSMKLATAICVLVYLLAGGARAGRRRQRHSLTIPGGGDVSVEVPEAARYLSRQDAAGNTRYNLYTWFVELDEHHAYLATVAVFPVDFGAANARRILEGGLRAGATRTSSGQWTSVEWK